MYMSVFRCTLYYIVSYHNFATGKNSVHKITNMQLSEKTSYDIGGNSLLLFLEQPF